MKKTEKEGSLMEFIIRPINIGDEKEINELRRMPGVFENILGIPSERIKQNEDFIIHMDNKYASICCRF